MRHRLGAEVLHEVVSETIARLIRGVAHEELAEDCSKTSQSKTEKPHSECEHWQSWVILQ